MPGDGTHDAHALSDRQPNRDHVITSRDGMATPCITAPLCEAPHLNLSRLDICLLNCHLLCNYVLYYRAYPNFHALNLKCNIFVLTCPIRLAYYPGRITYIVRILPISRLLYS